jgi:hypothetical protein
MPQVLARLAAAPHSGGLFLRGLGDGLALILRRAAPPVNEKSPRAMTRGRWASRRGDLLPRPLRLDGPRGGAVVPTLGRVRGDAESRAVFGDGGRRQVEAPCDLAIRCRPAGGSRYGALGAFGDCAGAGARDAVECRIPAAISAFRAARISARATFTTRAIRGLVS